MAWSEFIWRCTKDEVARRAKFPNGNFIVREGPQPSEFFKPRSLGPPAHCGFSSGGPDVPAVSEELARRIERTLANPLERLFAPGDYQVSPIGNFGDIAL